MLAALKEETEMSRAPAGVADEAALGELVDAHRGVVAAVLCKRYAGALGFDDIEDVVSVATHRMWKHVAEIPGLAAPRAWFLRIADNVAKDVLRYGWQKARQLEVVAEQAWLESFPTAPRVLPDPVALADPAIVRGLREIVAALPDAQRRIVWADALNPDGPVASELLARELGIPPGTVRVYRKRGLDRIRAEMHRRNLNPEKP